MVKPRDPFRKWEVVEKGNNIKFYLCTFDHEKIHAATTINKVHGETTYCVKRSFLEACPMVLKYMSKPSLFSFALIEQWL